MEQQTLTKPTTVYHNQDKVILDLCGGTGSWSKPYKDAGYDVRLMTLPDYDVTKWRDYDDLLDLIESGAVYGVLATPPCTMFSFARRGAKTPPDFRGAMETVQACLEIIWECQYNAPLKFWALENPRGYLRRWLGIPKHTFYQWQFGGQHKKPSDFWGVFNPPNPTVKIEPYIDVDKTWQKPVAPEIFSHMRLDRTAIRAITPPIFALKFYEANK